MNCPARNTTLQTAAQKQIRLQLAPLVPGAPQYFQDPDPSLAVLVAFALAHFTVGVPPSNDCLPAFSFLLESPSQLNLLPSANFIGSLGGVDEHSERVARKASARRPFLDRAVLVAHLRAVVDAATKGEKLALNRADPCFAAKMARGRRALFRIRPRTGRRDQARSAFPFLIGTRLTTEEGTLTIFRDRNGNSRPMEIKGALRHLHGTARLRIEDLVALDLPVNLPFISAPLLGRPDQISEPVSAVPGLPGAAGLPAKFPAIETDEPDMVINQIREARFSSRDLRLFMRWGLRGMNGLASAKGNPLRDLSRWLPPRCFPRLKRGLNDFSVAHPAFVAAPAAGLDFHGPQLGAQRSHRHGGSLPSHREPWSPRRSVTMSSRLSSHPATRSPETLVSL